MTSHLRATRSLTTWFAMGLLALAAGCGPQNEPSQLIASARNYMAKKDREAAIIQLKNALQKEPTNGEARYLLGTLLLESGDLLSAEKELRRALDYNYSRDAVVPTLAAAMSRLGQWKQLASEFAETTLNDPEAQAKLKNELGYAYLALGQVKEARASFAAALAVQPGNPRGRIGEARIMAMGQDLPGAMKVVEEVIAKSPANPDALELKIALLLAQNDREPAKQTLVQLIQAQPANIQARSALVSMLIDDRSFDKAQTELEAMKKRAPRDIRSRYLEAMLASRKGEPAKAKDSILELVKVSPDFIPGRVLAGAIELQLGQFVTAEDHLRRAVAAEPRNRAARVLLAATYIRQGQPDKAEEVLEPALRLEPGNPRVLQTAGEAALARGDFARASSYYERATAADKENAALRAQLARARFASGDPEQGLKDLEAASAIDAAQYQADIALILAHISRREFDKALAAADTLEKKQPENPLTYRFEGHGLPAQRRPERRAYELRKGAAAEVRLRSGAPGSCEHRCHR